MHCHICESEEIEDECRFCREAVCFECMEESGLCQRCEAREHSLTVKNIREATLDEVAERVNGLDTPGKWKLSPLIERDAVIEILRAMKDEP